MKKIIIISALILGISSCSHPVSQRGPTNELQLNTSASYSQQYRIYTLEGCEYIVVSYGSERWGSHKGNCKNPIHQK